MRMNISNQNPVRAAADCVGGITSLSKLIDVSVPTVHQWITGVRRVPTERAIRIEEATKGQVKAEELRPDVPWHVIRNAPKAA